MKELDAIDIKFRNIALILIFIAIIILIIWITIFLQSGGEKLPLLLAIGIALLLAGILMLTRIQYIIWIKKRFMVHQNKYSKTHTFGFKL